MVTPAVQLYINKVNVLVNLDGAKNVLVDKQHWQNWKKDFGFFQWAGWGGLGTLDSQVTTGTGLFILPLYHVSSCFLACLSFRLPKAHSEDVRNKHKLYKVEVDPDTDMKASADFI